MKLKYILSVVLTALLIMGCSTEDGTIGTYGALSQDDSYVILPVDGGSATVTLNADADWSFATELPSWLTVDKTSGSAGANTLTFSAESTNGGREAELCLNIGSKKQYLKVRQGSMDATDSKCSEILAGPDGKTYRVKGTVTAIANTTYGNWYLNDGTGEVYIYGTLDAKGATKNFASLGIEVGDVVTVEGPKKTYNGTVELVDVTVKKIVKSLLKVVTPNAEIAKEGGNFSVKVAYKGNGVNMSIPSDVTWVKFVKSEFIAGKKTIYDTAAPADTTVLYFSADANESATRTANIEISSSNASSSSKVSYTVKQAGIANPPTGKGTKADPFNVPAVINYVKALGADVVSTDDVYVKGKISSIKYTYSASFGTATYNISADGKEDNVFTVYGSYFFGNKPWEEGQTQIAVGDEVVVCGKVIYYKGTTPEFSNKKNWLVSLNGKESEGGSEKGADGSTIISVADFNAAAESTDVWYQLTGKVTNLKDGDKYGNFDLVDETGSVYVYGVLSTKGGEKKKFQELVATYGIKEGSTITIVGNRGSYGEKIEVMNAYFISVK